MPNLDMNKYIRKLAPTTRVIVMSIITCRSDVELGSLKKELEGIKDELAAGAVVALPHDLSTLPHLSRFDTIKDEVIYYGSASNRLKTFPRNWRMTMVLLLVYNVDICSKVILNVDFILMSTSSFKGW